MSTAERQTKPRSGDADWLSQRERGAVWLIHAALRMAQIVGRPLMKPVVLVIALYYRLTDRKAARASRAWLTRVHGRPATFWETFRHIHTFAQVTLDRILLVSGKGRAFRFTRTGNEHIAAQFASRRGAVLLGGHIGSFEAMRTGGEEDRVRINVLGHFANAQMINALLEKLDPERAAQVIHIGDDPVGQMARVHDRIEAGDFVALLGDRIGLNERTVTVQFFGAPARFPAGPFLLAALMKCPVYLTFGLYRRPNQYDLSCEPFADRLHLPRKDRDAALQDFVQRYAERLEHYARSAPYNWFNFYDFWQDDSRRDAPRSTTRA